MSSLHLKIITPQKVALEEDVLSVTAPSASGEVTILPKHMNLFSLLQEGIVTIRKQSQEDHLAIGGGYLETDGEELNILVSRAYGQGEIDTKETERAIEEANKILSQSKDESQKQEAISMLRRSAIDIKLLKRRKAKSSV